MLDHNAHLVLPPLPSVATDAPPLRKVQFEQLQEGLGYLKYANGVIKIGSWNSQFFQEYVKSATEFFLVAAELEETPAKRIPWYEARIRWNKDIETFIAIRVQNGTDPPQRLNQVRFLRLQAEADLLKFKAEIEKVGKK